MKSFGIMIADEKELAKRLRAELVYSKSEDKSCYQKIQDEFRTIKSSSMWYK